MRYSMPRGKMKDNGFSLRLAMVKLAQCQGISEAARQMRTSRQTVRKWLGRFHERALSGLTDFSRAPHRSPGKIPGQLEERIRELRGRYRWGPKRLKVQCGLPCSEGAIYRVIRQAGLISKRRRKYLRKRDPRELKKRLRPFEKIQLYVKDLSDIPEYWPPAVREGLPRYEFTAREMRTGATFLGYAPTNDGTHAAAFATYLAEHPRNYGVELEALRFQTDPPAGGELSAYLATLPCERLRQGPSRDEIPSRGHDNRIFLLLNSLLLTIFAAVCGIAAS